MLVLHWPEKDDGDEARPGTVPGFLDSCELRAQSAALRERL